MASSPAALMLKRQLAELSKHPVEGFSAGLKGDNIFTWEVRKAGAVPAAERARGARCTAEGE